MVADVAHSLLPSSSNLTLKDRSVFLSNYMVINKSEANYAAYYFQFDEAVEPSNSFRLYSLINLI